MAHSATTRERLRNELDDETLTSGQHEEPVKAEIEFRIFRFRAREHVAPRPHQQPLLQAMDIPTQHMSNGGGNKIWSGSRFWPAPTDAPI